MTSLVLSRGLALASLVCFNSFLGFLFSFTLAFFEMRTLPIQRRNKSWVQFVELERYLDTKYSYDEMLWLCKNRYL